jgi:hypothetical protein
MSYTPLVYTPHNYYTIATQSISLGGKRLVINQVRWEPPPTTLPAAPPPNLLLITRHNLHPGCLMSGSTKMA